MKSREMKLFITTLLVLSILSLSMVSAIANPVASNITINIPATSGTLTGATAVFNITIITGFEAQNWSQVNVYLKSVSLTANTSDFLASRGYNYTTILTLNGTLDSTIFEDANDYTITFELRNGSNNFNATRSGITINNTIPQSATSLTPTSDTDGTVTFSSNVIGRNTTACTLFFTGINPGNPSYTMTHSGSTCTYDSLSMAEETYNWYVRSSDGSDTTNSGSQTTTVDISSGSIKGKALLASGNAEISQDGKTLSIVSEGLLSKPVAIVGIIFGIVMFLGVVGFFIFRKK